MRTVSRVLTLLALPLTPHARADELFPVRRVELPPERVAAEMQRQGVLAQLPREQFEGLLRQAAEAEAAGKDPPRLVRAHYRATLRDDGLVGTAEWTVRHGHDQPGRLPLGALQLALRSARWSDRAPVVLGTLDDGPGAGLELLVAKKGERALLLDWSARGLPEPGGIRFDLRMPPCALTVLELDMPVGHVVQADRETAVLSGPEAGADAALRTWRLTFPRAAGSALTARLTVRRPPAADEPSPLLRTFTQTTQKLTAGQVECGFQVDVQVQHGEVRQLALELDPALRVEEVQSPGLGGWSLGGESGTRVDVTFREPFRGGRVDVRALAALPGPDRAWVSPGLRVVGAQSRGERLALQIHPDLSFEGWDAGGFRPLPATADAGPFQVVALQARGIGAEAGARPRAHIRRATGAFRTAEAWEWRAGPGGMALTADVQIIPRRGPVFRSDWQLPAGWDVEGVEARPPDPGLRWEIRPAGAGSPATLAVEPARPFTGSDLDPRLVIRLRAAGSPAATATLPALVPLWAAAREGTLTVRAEPPFVPGPAVRLGVAQPFRGAPEASLLLRPRHGRVDARCAAEAVVTRGSLRMTYQLTLSAAAGGDRDLLLAVSAPVTLRPGRVTGGAAQVRALERFELPWAPGRFWRLRLDRPLSGQMAVELTTEPAPAGASMSVPLLTVVAADQFNGRVTIRTAPGAAWVVDAPGLEEEPASGEEDGWTRRSFRYGPGSTRLMLRSMPESPTAAGARVADAALVIRPSIGGETHYRLRFKLGSWPRGQLAVRLPAAARPISAKVNGASVTTPAAGPPEPHTLVLPWNPARDWAEVEVTFAVPDEPIGPAARLRAAMPQLPMPADVRVTWELPAGVLPASASGRRLFDLAAGPAADLAEWEAGDDVWVVRWWTPLVPGGIIALALVALGAALRRGRSMFLAGWLFLGALGIIWLPALGCLLVALPLLGGVAFTAALLVARVFRGPPAAVGPRSSSGRAAPAAATALGLALAVGVRSAPPVPTTVYLVPGPAARSQTVLTPPDFLEALRAAARQGAPGTDAVLLGAHYEGKVLGAEVRWAARFDAYSFRPGRADVAVRLPEARLLAAEVDGREALPRPGDEAGRFEFDLAGAGAHTLVLTFTTPATGDRDRETRFSIPELPITSCAVDFPAGVDEPLNLSARGAQRAGRGGAGPRLEADMGRAGVIQLRWRQPSPAPAPRVPAQAVHLWELAESHARLLSVFRFRFGSAAARRLEFDVPAGLELADVSVRHVDDPLGLVGLARLKDWRRAAVAGAERHRLEFAAPLTGWVQVELELSPRGPPGTSLLLAFPEVAGDFEREAAAAVRASGLTVAAAEAHGWEPIRTDEFLRDLWRPLRVDAVDQGPELAFRRGRGPNPRLRLDVRVPPPSGDATQRLEWLVGQVRAELQASAAWSAAPESGPVEWEVPAAVTVSEVRGEGLRSWSRSGSRLQAWFDSDRPNGPVALALTGSLPLSAGAGADSPATFTAAPLVPLGVTVVETRLSVQAREGWRLRPLDPGPYRPLPDSDLPGVRWSGYAAAPGPAAFTLRPARGTARGDVLTLVESAGRQLAFRVTADITATADGGLPATLLLEVRRVEGERPQLVLPAGVRVREARPGPQDMTWLLDCQPGRHRLELTGRFAAGLGPPAVTVRGAGEAVPAVRRWLTVAAGLRADDVTGLRPALIPASLLPAGPAGVKGWEVPADDGTIRLTSAGGAGRAQALAGVTATPAGGAWLVRMHCLFAADADVTLRFPAGAELFSARLDGRELPRAGRAGQLRLPAGGKLRSLRLVWRTAPGEEFKAQLPRLEVTGEPVTMSATDLTVSVPAGFRLESTATPLAPREAAAERAAAREAFLRQVGPSGADSYAAAERNLTGPYDDAFTHGTPYEWHFAGEETPHVRLVPETSGTVWRLAASIALAAILLAGARVSSHRG